MTPSCPFCDFEAGRVLIRLQHVIAIWDAYPVADGHALIVPIRHVSNWFDAAYGSRLVILLAGPKENQLNGSALRFVRTEWDRFCCQS